MKDPYPQKEHYPSLFSLPDYLLVNSVNFYLTQILLSLARIGSKVIGRELEMQQDHVIISNNKTKQN